MSRTYRRVVPFFCLGLLAFAACRDSFSPPSAPDSVSRPLFAQGDDGVWTVTTLDDPGDGTCDDTECTLREAIAAAGFGDLIGFAAGLAGDIRLTQGQLIVVDKRLTIDGDGRIEVDAQSESRVLAADGGSRPRLLTLKGITIKNGNSADQNGGGILIFGEASLRLERVFVRNNRTQADGGGVYISADGGLEMINSTIDDNRAVSGAGVRSLAPVSISGSTISRNIAESRGAGIRLSSSELSSIDRSTISGNRVGPLSPQPASGGGVFASQGTLQIRSSTITGNSAEGEFGQGGGIYLDVGTLTMANSILAGNTATLIAGDCADFSGVSTSLGYNLYTSGNVTNCFFTPGTGDVELSPAQIFTEVLEQTLKNNGGPTQTHALIVRGRAMDAGYCPGETADQRGLARPVDIEVMANAVDGCDIGAYELQGPVIARTDLMVSLTSDKSSVKAGDLLTYVVRVRNLGPEKAPNVVLTNVLSSGVAFVSATHAKGTHTAPPVGETGTVTWYLGDLLDQANETAEIKVTVRIKGKTTIDNTASVSADAIDINPANNTATLKVSVGAGGGKNK